MLLMVYPQMIPGKGQSTSNEGRRDMGTVGQPGGTAAAAAKTSERYEPKVFGFKVHEEAKLARWRTARRDQ
jgi:casein kinase II subunit beta